MNLLGEEALLRAEFDYLEDCYRWGSDPLFREDGSFDPSTPAKPLPFWLWAKMSFFGRFDSADWDSDY